MIEERFEREPESPPQVIPWPGADLHGDPNEVGVPEGYVRAIEQSSTVLS